MGGGVLAKIEGKKKNQFVSSPFFIFFIFNFIGLSCLSSIYGARVIW